MANLNTPGGQNDPEATRQSIQYQILATQDPRQAGNAIAAPRGTLANMILPDGSQPLLLQKQDDGLSNNWTIVGPGGGGGGFTPVAKEFQRYVDSDNGNDTTGNGSYELPYKTIAKAISTCVTPETVKYVIFLISNDNPDEGPLAWAAGISLAGMGRPTSVNSKISYVGTATDDLNIFFSNIVFQQQMDIDASLNTGGVIIFTGIGNTAVNRIDSNPAVFILNSTGLADSVIRGTFLVQSAAVTGNLDVQPGASLSIFSSAIIGQITLTGTAALQTRACQSLFGGSYVTGVPVGPDTPTWKTDEASKTTFTGSVTQTVFGQPEAALSKSLYVAEAEGNDTTGNGSLEAPFKTVGAALAVATDGTTILVMDGNYSEPGDLTWKNNVNMRGNTANSCVLNFNINYASLAAETTIFQFQALAINGVVTLDLALAGFASVSMNDGRFQLNRVDNNLNAIVGIQGGVFDSTIGGRVQITGFIFGVITVPPGATLYLTQATFIGGSVEVSGTGVVETRACVANNGFINGTPVGPDTPAWNTDASSDVTYTGTLTKTVFGASSGITYSHWLFVDPITGNDGTGLPYLTITAALAAAAALAPVGPAADDNRVGVVLAPGQYNVEPGDLTLPFNVSLIGAGRQLSLIGGGRSIIRTAANTAQSQNTIAGLQVTAIVFNNNLARNSNLILQDVQTNITWDGGGTGFPARNNHLIVTASRVLSLTILTGNVEIGGDTQIIGNLDIENTNAYGNYLVNFQMAGGLISPSCNIITSDNMRFVLRGVDNQCATWNASSGAGSLPTLNLDESSYPQSAQIVGDYQSDPGIGYSKSIAAADSPYTMGSERILVVSVADGPVDVILPRPAERVRRRITIKKTNTGQVDPITITPIAPGTIDQNSNLVMDKVAESYDLEVGDPATLDYLIVGHYAP